MELYCNFIYVSDSTIVPNENENIAKTLFNHLQMFQYLEDVRNEDEKILSTFKAHSVKLNDKINVEFLKRWDKDQNLGAGNVKHWKLREESISEQQFIGNYIQDHNTEGDDDVFGGPFFSESLTVNFPKRKT